MAYLVAFLIFWAFDFEIDGQAMLYASATLVAILPEAAIVLITVTMAIRLVLYNSLLYSGSLLTFPRIISTQRMAAANTIVRKMKALEQLGRVTDTCSDKAGTLTEGRLTFVPVVIRTNLDLKGKCDPLG